MREWKGFGEGVTVKIGGEVVYIQKKERAGTLPCGTPLTTDEYSEFTPFKVTH